MSKDFPQTLFHPKRKSEPLSLIFFFSFFKGMPFSVYGNAMIPPVAPIPDGAGGPIFNGPHAADPSWNSLIKMVSSSTENNGPQTVRLIIH